MNTIKKDQPILENTTTVLNELLDRTDNGKSETAFIGRCGNGPENSLYLITYSSVVLATNPQRDWCDDYCQIVINRFVDIVITIKEK